jgi:hypothetical protein
VRAKQRRGESGLEEKEKEREEKEQEAEGEGRRGECEACEDDEYASL